MGNSDLMAVVLEREANQEAIDALREVLEKHNITLEIEEYGDALRILRGSNTVKTIYGELTAEDLNQ